MNHFMMGHLNNLLVPYILGIWREEGKAVIAPHPMGDLSWCRGTSNGFKVSWRIENQTFVLDVDIPEGEVARIRMPYNGKEQTLSAGQYTIKETIK